MDYLPVQASSVPCERVFSSSGETDTKKRNRLASDLMEGLQILKYIRKIMILLTHAYCDLMTLLSPIKPKATKPDHAYAKSSLPMNLT
jgi:hypothetical protein